MIYEAAVSGKWTPFLERILSVTQSNKAFINFVDVTNNEVLVLDFATTIKNSTAILEYKKNPNDDPYRIITNQMTEGDVLLFNDFFDIHSQKETDYYRDIIIPMDSGQVIGACLTRDGRYESMFVVNRGFNDRKYEERDTSLISALTPHLVRAIAVHNELNLLKNLVGITSSIVDQSTYAVVVCDKNATIVLSNKYAQENLFPSASISNQNGVLTIGLPIYQDKLVEYINHCVALSFQKLNTQETIIVEENNCVVARINIAPIISPVAELHIDKPLALVSIHKPKNVSEELLVKDYRLTLAEVTLVSQLCQRTSLRQVSEATGRSYNTLRVQMQSIYKKFQVSSQLELMMKINQLT